jgi:hypothetical protein
MKGVWHYWMQQNSLHNTIETTTVRSDDIPYGMKVYAQANLSQFLVTELVPGVREAGVEITAYGQYTDRESWHTVKLLSGDFRRNFIFLENCAWVEATLTVISGSATAGLSIIGY